MSLHPKLSVKSRFPPTWAHGRSTGHECWEKRGGNLLAYQQSSRDPSSWDHSCRGPCRGRMCHAHCTGLGIGPVPAHSLDHPSQGCRGILHLRRPHGWSRWDPSNQLKEKKKKRNKEEEYRSLMGDEPRDVSLLLKKSVIH